MDRRTIRTAVAAILGLVAALVASVTATAPTHAEGSMGAGNVETGNIVTPGNFTGYGFDQCLAPTQKAMNAWLRHSPFLAVGIYITGESRACRHQPNLTPDWISTQLRKGWRLLPITLGPQASCSTRFPRYGHDETIDDAPGKRGKYRRARTQGRAEAETAVAAARALGIVKGSTLWYDIEGFDSTRTHCRESALAFLSAWTNELHNLEYVSGVYSSVGSGIKMLDDARVDRPGAFNLPDQIWLARWDGVANTSSSYIREDGWRPHARVKQYMGGHDETWGGVRINIDRNFLNVGRGSVAAPESHCDGVTVDFPTYRRIRPGSTASERVTALQCLLKEQEVYRGRLSGVYSRATIAAVHAWQEQRGLPVSDTWSRRGWMTLLIKGPRAMLKIGSAGPDVRRLQRALNAASKHAQLKVSGVFRVGTGEALREYQSQVGLKSSPVAGPATWRKLRAGVR